MTEHPHEPAPTDLAADAAGDPAPGGGASRATTDLAAGSSTGDPAPGKAPSHAPTDLAAALEEIAALQGQVEKERKKRRKVEEKSGKLGTSRGVETMFRTSYQTHNDLSQLADNKANIMISINGIIISILLASIAPRIGANPWLLLPTAVLLVGCVVSMVYAVLAARPRVSSGGITLDEVRSEEANILFFGNFVQLSEEDFVSGMRELITHTDQLYLNMVRDIYALGRVLARKFRLLRVSYNAFMAGLVAGVTLFLVVFALVVAEGSAPVMIP